MTLIVDATTDPTMTAASSEDDTGSDAPDASAQERRRIDVTDMPADDIAGFVEENVDTRRVSLESCGAQTYLVLEE
ncbi:hypothetical protein [Natronolimnobius baerhuensis]|uniref:Uncharacterized protein n=1 Tax=Natronolimnobius baerhuensis TaxID=253108 RepID=A0A202EB64_9EURY|nr:hypothetical protein [Natronolimnobius baerhuensis]OVE85471.1 hypothetical protein B2G88_01185 [Natronolimnobius baerhuensis]